MKEKDVQLPQDHRKEKEMKEHLGQGNMIFPLSIQLMDLSMEMLREEEWLVKPKFQPLITIHQIMMPPDQTLVELDLVLQIEAIFHKLDLKCPDQGIIKFRQTWGKDQHTQSLQELLLQEKIKFQGLDSTSQMTQLLKCLGLHAPLEKVADLVH
jgi:hypothetical protein